MANTKKLIGAGALSLALAGGGVAGALLGAPGTSGAQETTTEVAQDAPRHRGGHLEAAAEALGMTVDELRAELQDGSTIAEVANEQGVDVDVVIDAMVAAATEDMRERLTAIVNGEVPPGGHRHGHGRGDGHRRGPGPGLSTAAEILGLTAEELHEAIRSGQTLAEVAEAEGVDVATLIEELVAAATARLDEKVADGTISEERAAEIEAGLVDRITAKVNGEGGPGRP